MALMFLKHYGNIYKHQLCAVNGNSSSDGNICPGLKISGSMGGKKKMKEGFA